MLTPSRAESPRHTARATALATVALGSAVLIWRLRPPAPTTSAIPATEIALGCAWLAWGLLGYLAVAVTATCAGHTVAILGVNGDRMSRLAPLRLARLVDVAITVSVAAALLGTSSSAQATTTTRHHTTSSVDVRSAAGDALDWPGLSAATGPLAGAAAPSHSRHRRHRAQIGLVSGGRSAAPSPPASTHQPTIVQAGDSLWSIAARHLGPAATAQATAIAWHQWYAANRQVVGDDPDLIYPGQRLRAPGTTVLPARHGAGTR